MGPACGHSGGVSGVDWTVKPHLEHVKGDTWCIVTGYSRIPLFRLGGGRAVLLDSGLAKPDRQGIFDLLRREGLRVEAVLTSHAHIDHTGNHRALQEEHGAVICMSLFDAAVSSTPMNLKSYLYGTSYRGTIAYGESMLCRADRLIGQKDETVDVGGAQFPILRLPGHAPEHLGFVTPDGVAYLADALMSDQVLDSVRIPYCMCCELDLQTKERLKTLEYDAYIIPHNAVCTEIAGLAERNRQKLLKKIEVVAGLADRFLSMEELVARSAAAMGVRGDTVYKIRVAERNIHVFAEHLLDTGRLVQRANNGIIEYIRADCL